MASTANAQAVQPWPDLLVNAHITKGVLASGEVIGRIADDTRTSQFETRAQIGHAFGKAVILWAGWVHIANYNPHAHNGVEDQAVEQLNWTIGAIHALHFSTRTRLEQRHVRGVDGTSWRWRQQMRATMPLGGAGSPGATVWVEPFLSLNRTAAQSHVLDQLRTFAGISVPVSRRVDVEFGFLNQRIYRPTVTVVNNAVPIILTMRF